MENPRFLVSDFIASVNQTLEYAYTTVEVEGEVASFKVNQGKFVFFDLKDEESSIGCFMMLFNLRQPIEDGMKVVVRAQPKLTKWGKFSLTIQSIRPVGEGSLRRSFELLRAKLDKEGLFALERKRLLPQYPQHIAVVSSTQAAGYADFIRILGERWGGIDVRVAHVPVQGEAAPSAIQKAIEYLNQQESVPEVIVVIRGGGSADDLAAFNDEQLVRTIAASRVPVLTGIGHDTDESLVDMVADVAAATPSNAAQLLVPDKQEVLARIKRVQFEAVLVRIERAVNEARQRVYANSEQAVERIGTRLEQLQQRLAQRHTTLDAYNPRNVLRRGYAIVRGTRAVGEQIHVEEINGILTARVENYEKR